MVAGPVTNAATAVSNSHFTVTVDFGSSVFGQQLWLEIAVRTNGSGAFTTLAPRQAFTPVPVALFAAAARTNSGPVAAAQLTGVLPLSVLPAGALTTNAAALPYNGSQSGLGATNVQAAIDKVAGQLSTNQNGLWPRVVLPDEFVAVVGDKLQLFVRGMIEAQNPYAWPYEIVCAKGSQYPRYFEYTPSAGDPPTQTLTVNVLDHTGNVRSTASTTLRVLAANHAPQQSVTVLCVGDSLTATGVWPVEFYRRVTQTGGSPPGSGYANVNFVGDSPMHWSYPSQSYMGWPGWGWANYETGITGGAVWVASAHDKTYMDVDSGWKDASNANSPIYILMQVAPNALKFMGSPTLATAPGTLTNAYGAFHPASITYTGVTNTVASPLWNGNAFSFASLTNQAPQGISICYVLLGWCSLVGPNEANAADNSATTAQAQQFITQFHTDFPAGLVRLIGLNLPSNSGGLGATFGANNWQYSNYYKLLRTVNGLNQAYQQLCNQPANSSFCKFINLSCQVDSENNMQTASVPVNSRSATTELRGTDGVHPTTEGYNQIADAVWRDFIRTFCQ